MKSTRFAVLLLLVAGFSASAYGEWNSIGALKAKAAQGNQFIFSNDQNQVVVTILAPDMARVRVVWGAQIPPDHSYAVAKTDWPAVKVDVANEPGARVLRTSAMQVRVQLSPFRISFLDAQGKLIAKDADSRGMSRDGDRIRCWKWAPEDEQYFGLGEKSTPLEKRGRSYVMWNRDPAGFDASTDPLYQSVPFFLALRQGRAYGIFFDNTFRSSFDMAAEAPDLYSFGAEGGELNYYFFAGPTPKDVIGRFTELVGRAPLPPRWALGYIQSRYSYYPESKVRFIADNFRLRQIPCDGIFLDIDYMNGFRIFTWNKDYFPDPKSMLTGLRKQGIHIIAIMDPYVKVDPGYWVYDQGVKGGYLLKKADGTLATGSGWPGESAFPDFASAKTRDWWAGLFKEQLEQGIAGFLTDMNEPTVVINPGPVVKTLDLNLMHDADGTPRPHAEIHNVYGMLETMATREGMLHVHPNERPLIITRATYAGGQRYAAQWSGDNWGTWDHLRLSMPMLMNMGLSGLQFSGADIGGISPVPSPELYARWMQTGLLTPFAWTHSAGPGNLEPWAFGNRLEAINRSSIELRYRLLPYIYTAFWEASKTGVPIMRPLLLEFPADHDAVAVNDEYLFGNDLLVAPVTKDDETSRSVYLPAGAWYDYWSGLRYDGPANIEAAAPMERIPLFVRGGAILPSQQLVQYTDQAPIDPLTLDVYPAGVSTRSYYEDDGISFDYMHGVYLLRQLTARETEKGVRVELGAPEGTYAPAKRSLVVKVHAQLSEPAAVSEGRGSLPRLASADALAKADTGWRYDADERIVWVKIPDPEAATEVDVAR